VLELGALATLCLINVVGSSGKELVLELDALKLFKILNSESKY
jgi:hypothetical protein